MRIAIVGSRGFPNLVRVELYVLRLNQDDVVISGGAEGVDSKAVETAKATGIEWKEHLPDWEKWGKAAGFMRNEDIVQDADRVVAFWDGKSRGTKNSIDLALTYKKPLEVYFP